jgi:hypothetical protein
MTCCSLRRLTASALSLALVVSTAPAFAAPAPATLTGTVYANDVVTPLAGATVIVTDANGVKIASQPTGANGVFTSSPCPWTDRLTLETKEGSLPSTVPRPGRDKGRPRAQATASQEGKEGGWRWTGGEIASMTCVLVGFAAAGWLAYDRANEDEAQPASPYVPPSN